MVGIIKKVGKALKAAKKAKDSSAFLKRRETLGGASKGKGYPDWFKKWLKDNPIPRGTPGPKTKKKQMEKFVDIRKRTKLTRQKKKFD